MSSDKGRVSAGWVQRLPKRFYKAVRVKPAEGGLFSIALDERDLCCPGGALFRAPERVAAAVAAEWEGVQERIDPATMPITKAVNSAIEQVAPQRDAVIEEIAGYGGSDLLCYRADAPSSLAEREAAAWDPILDWSAERYGARLTVGAGVTPIAQEPEALQALRSAVAAQSDLGLTALSNLVAISGSLLLGLAVAEGRLSAEQAWAASRVDEEWQIEQWGRDAEADDAAAEKKRAFLAAAALAGLIEPKAAEG